MGRYVVVGPGSKIDDVSQQAGTQFSVLYGWCGRAAVDVNG